MEIKKPDINPTFFYGPVISYEFYGGIAKDRGKYRIRFILYFKSGDSHYAQKGGFASQAEATKAKEVLIADLVRNEYIPFDYTVKEFFDYWLYYEMLEKKKIRYNTFQSYRNALYNHLLPALGEKTKLKDVSIESLTDAIRKVPYLSVKSNCTKLARLVFDDACSKHFIKFNPSIAAVQNVKKDIERKKKRNIAPFSVEQIRRLLFTCKENYREMYIPILMSITMGTRISETVAIKYSDIDFTSKTIYIRRQLGRDMDDDGDNDLVTKQLETKTANGVRCIPVPEWVVDELMVKRAWYEVQKTLVSNFRDLGYVCCRCNGTPFHRSSFGNDFHQLLGMCGLPDIHWHDLRHVYASVLKNNTVNLKAVSTYLGHYSPNFTEDVYVHQEEEVYDCSILQDVWEEIRPEEKNQKVVKLVVPFTDDDYYGFFNNVSRSATEYQDSGGNEQKS